MKKNWVLSQQSFDGMLEWLAPNREQAGLKYEEIRERLIRIFGARGCYESEDLTDETINRVANKITELKENYVGDPALYFYAVAKHVHQEYVRRKPATPPQLEPDNPSLREIQLGCLDECLEGLTSENRELVVHYYQYDKKAKIDGRRILANRLRIRPNALRIRAFRIRASLLKCVEKCLELKKS